MMLGIIICVTVYFQSASSYENIYGPLYGKEWLLMSDEEGYPFYVNFTNMPEEDNETRSYTVSNVYFYLFTRKNAEEPESLSVTKEKTVNSEYYINDNKLKVVTHGWMSSGDTEWIMDIKNAYLKNQDVNVITVDWSNLSRNPAYPWSALSTRYVGKRVAELLDALASTYGMTGNTTHLIGHSLGAQVMGYAGSYTKQNVSRITGLDPARPLFEIPNMGSDYRLERSDANFVDIIHTCGGIYGYANSHGHADFYPNNGKPPQPGCKGIQYMLEACSHGRSYQYFAESIDSDLGFVSYPCDSWESYQNGTCKDSPTLMGEPIDTASLGEYYLDTNSEPKFAKG